MDIKITIYVVMIFVLAIMLIGNFKVFKRKRSLKGYEEAYKSIINNEEKSYDKINDYISKEKKNEFKNKARIFKLLCELDNANYQETFKEIDLHDLFYSGSRYDKSKLELNTDTFVWTIILISKAYHLNDISFIEKVMKLFDVYKKDIDNSVEYKTLNNISKALCNKKDSGISYFSSFLQGDFKKYTYEKRMIGLYRRLISSTMLFLKKDISDVDFEDVKLFSKSKLGEVYLKNLNIYDDAHIDNE